MDPGGKFRLAIRLEFGSFFPEMEIDFRLLLDPVFLDFIVEGSSGDPEELGRLSLMAVGLFQGVRDPLLFKLADRLFRGLRQGEVARERDLDVLDAPEFVDQIRELDPLFRDHHRPLQEVPELANIAGEVVILEFLERLRGDLRDLFAHLGLQLPEDPRAEERDVLAPLTERRQMDRKLVQAVEEVQTKGPVF